MRPASARWFLLVAGFALPASNGDAAGTVHGPRTIALSEGWRFQQDPLEIGQAQG